MASDAVGVGVSVDTHGARIIPRALHISDGTLYPIRDALDIYDALRPLRRRRIVSTQVRLIAACALAYPSAGVDVRYSPGRALTLSGPGPDVVVSDLGRIAGTREMHVAGGDAAVSALHVYGCAVRVLAHMGVSLKGALSGYGTLAGAILRSLPSLRHTAEPCTTLGNAALYGGRVQVMRPGLHAGARHYDVRGAYAHALSVMPSLGELRHVDGGRLPARAHAICRVRWSWPGPYGPFPVRTAGGIEYPLAGAGWYLSPFVRAAIECTPDGGETEIEESYQWSSDDRLLADTVARALPLRDDADPVVRATAKGTVNALWGRMAERPWGWRRAPSHANPVLAAWVSAYVQAEMLRYITRTDGVLSVHTDGVWVARDAVAPVCGVGIGEWRCDRSDVATLLQAGRSQSAWVDPAGAWWQRVAGAPPGTYPAALLAERYTERGILARARGRYRCVVVSGDDPGAVRHEVATWQVAPTDAGYPTPTDTGWQWHAPERVDAVSWNAPSCARSAYANLLRAGIIT